MYVIALFLVFHVLPQLQSGTIVATEFSDERFIVAADSRTTDNDGKFTGDCECKIRVISKSMVFIGGGREHGEYGSLTAFDGWATAIRVRGRNNTASVEQMAHLWGQQMKVLLEGVAMTSPEALIGGIKTNIVAEGIFAGIANDGSLKAYTSPITYSLNGNRIVLTNTVRRLDSGIKLFFHSADLVQEFFDGKTKRAINRNSRLGKKISSEHIVDEEPYRIIAGVEAAVQWTKTGEIGGDVDALILHKGGKVTWLQKKKNCDDGQKH